MAEENKTCERELENNEELVEETLTPPGQEEPEIKVEKIEKNEKKKVKKLEAEIAELKTTIDENNVKIAELNDKYMRMIAEYDNFRKRSAKEKEGIYTDAYGDAISSILPVLDNIERASAYTDAEAVLKGVQMILKGAEEAFEKMGVKSFGQRGDEFDPNRHNAVMHVEDETLGENVIAEVFQKGYIKGDKIIRYAMVTVAN